MWRRIGSFEVISSLNASRANNYQVTVVKNYHIFAPERHKIALCKINSHKASKILTDVFRFPTVFYTENELKPTRISDAINI